MSTYRKARPRFRAGIEARLQRVALKVTYVRNNPSRTWAAHGSYLARQGAAKARKKGLGFDHEGEEIELRPMLKHWQGAGDELLFKLVVSPERGAEMDMAAHTRELVACMERDLRTRLEWAGISRAVWSERFSALSKLVFPTCRKWLTDDRSRGSISLGDYT
jgi:type IV secretory pathway VirD2 relaxase